MECLDQFPLYKKSELFLKSPLPLSFEAEKNLVEWLVNCEVSIPASPKTDFNHLATENLFTS